MNTTNIDAQEAFALGNAISAIDASTATKRGLLKTAQGIAAVAERNDIEHHEILEALSDGSQTAGGKMFYKSLAVLTRWLTPWGVLALLVFGFYQAIQTARGAAGAFVKMIQNMLSFVAPAASIGKAVGEAGGRLFGKFFKDASAEADPATGLAGLAQLIAVEVPMLGMMMRSYETTAPGSMPIGKGDLYTAPDAGGRALFTQEFDEDDDAQVDIAYDEEGDEVDIEDAEVGDVVYDGAGNAFAVDDAD